jgi:hypothetical protein
MVMGTAIDEPIRRCVEQAAGELPRDLRFESRTLSGGLEASQVALVTARFSDASGRPRMLRLVCKHLHGRAAREAVVYECLAAKHAADISPQLMGVERLGPDHAVLCLEAVRRTCAWPWRHLPAGTDLLARLARFHVSARNGAARMPEWDYDAELCATAETTWTALDGCRLHPDLCVLARNLRPLGRIVSGLPKLRRQMLGEAPFGSGPIHGDVHPGNALVRRRGRGEEPVLLDWGRARLGSPLEDVSSWLHSLGYYEEGARRRHDSLLQGFLSTFGAERRLTSGVRAAYWTASASNGLAGALLYHLLQAQDEHLPTARRALAFRAAGDWLRVIRRADAWSS